MAATIRLAVAALALGASPFGAAPAQADAPEAFTITEHINFVTGDFTFTATGPLCASGTFQDSVQPTGTGNSSSGTQVLLIRTTYTCADGSGTFYALKHVAITPTGEDSSTNSGPITLNGGTGDYAGLTGHGFDRGTSQGGLGVGNISGVVVRQGTTGHRTPAGRRPRASHNLVKRADRPRSNLTCWLRQ